MRCECCNVILTPQESVRKFKESGEYTNTCSSCLKYIDVPTQEGTAFDETMGHSDHSDSIIDEEKDDDS